MSLKHADSRLLALSMKTSFYASVLEKMYDVLEVLAHGSSLCYLDYFRGASLRSFSHEALNSVVRFHTVTLISR